MSITVTSEIIRDLCSSNRITIIQKRQKNTGDYNFYITPNLSLQLYGGKVIITDPKFLVVQFEKSTHITLLSLLRTTSECITDYLKSCIELDIENVYPLFSEQDNTFTIRVYLPHVRNKYFIETKSANENEIIQFTRPRIGTVLKELRVDIRNLWQNKQRLGFNLELKYIELV